MGLVQTCTPPTPPQQPLKSAESLLTWTDTSFLMREDERGLGIPALWSAPGPAPPPPPGDAKTVR